MKTIQQPSREIPVVADVDVCVVGGGPGGLTAAWQAARHGAETLLIEQYGFLGGMATMGMVGPILGLKEQGADRPVVEGVTREFCERLHELGVADPWEECVKSGRCQFSVEEFKLVADRMCKETGVRVLFHSFATDCIVDRGRLDAVIIENKSGRQAVRAGCFIDATGDADLAFRAGAETTLGRPADGKPMAMGSMFWVTGMEDLTHEKRVEAKEIITEAINEGKVAGYHGGLGGQGSITAGGMHSVNITRFPGDATDAEVLSEGEMHVREETWKMVQFWKENVPGLEDVELIATAPHIGIRETRQIVGEERITGEDVIAGAKSDEAVARCSYWIDIHCPRGFVKNGVHLCKKDCPNASCYMLTNYEDQVPGELHPPDYFDIPYGALVPADIDGLLVSGRCISADHQAMSAVRIMATCMGIGEAAGVAAVMSTDAGIPARDVNVGDLRERLHDAGAVC